MEGEREGEREGVRELFDKKKFKPNDTYTSQSLSSFVFAFCNAGNLAITDIKFCALYEGRLEEKREKL